MGLYGQHWKFDGVPAAFVTRGSDNGHYNILFEREFASIEQIDAINWSRPIIEHLVEQTELGLPEGYGFEVVNVSYYNGTRTYTVELKTAKQYLGDVTGYQAQIDELDQVVAQKEATIAEQSAAISAKDAQLAEKDEIIENQAAAAQAREEELAAAYMEGVESNG